MAADRPRHEAFMGEAIQAAILSVARRGREHQCEIPG
jgi:hypothetical protein